MDGDLVQETAAQTKRRLRSIHWKHPPKTRWPLASEKALARLGRASANPHGQEYAAIFDGAPVAGRSVRRRRKRSDGGINTCSLLCAVIGSADLGNGLIGTPVGGGKWRLKSWADLAGISFGKTVQGALSTRRVERCARELVALGYIQIQQWRVKRDDGEIRSTPGIKHVTDRCWKALGVYGLVQQERRRRDRERKKEKESRIATLVPRSSGHRRQGGAKPMANPPRRIEAYTKPPHDPPLKGAGQVGQAIDLEALWAATRAHLAAGEAS